MERTMERTFWRRVVLAALLFGLTESDKEGRNEHAQTERKEIMLDPTADTKYYTKFEDMTFVKPEFTGMFEGHNREKRLASKTANMWEDGVIPYTFATHYSLYERSEIIRAMAEYEEKTCIRFTPRTNQRDYIEYFKGPGCVSFVGKVGGKQGVSLQRTCIDDYGLVLHEIGHVLGLLHEHIRPDRDDYVDILHENINRGALSEFLKSDPSLVDTLGVGYDYNSVMHYHPTAFGIRSRTTIQAHDENIVVGFARQLSELDVMKINILYGCTSQRPPKQTVYVPLPPPSPPPRRFDCGGFIDNTMTGVISSPGFPEYRTNQDCQWQIRGPTGFQIKFEIESIGLKESSTCDDNYIELYERLDCTGYMLGRVCRSDDFRVYYAFQHIGCILYHTGSSSSGSSRALTGFKISYSMGDVNECLFPFICQYGCVNTPGDFVCTCPEGYFQSSDGRHCFDINECALSERHMCEYKCVNRGGSHHCECPDGSLQEGESCSATSPPSVNECLTNNGGCSHTCTDTTDSFTCSCPGGYSLMEDKLTCKLTNECLVSNGGCSHVCTNTDDSYFCSCPTGYSLGHDQRTCELSNECLVENGGCSHICIDTDGSFLCSCPSGYSLMADKRTCGQSNECLISNGGCSHTCTDTDGSFLCSCPSGYSLMADKRTCGQSNECLISNGGCSHTCTDTDGSFLCSCPSGYSLMEDKHTCKISNECFIENGGCSHICINTQDSYVCSCPSGYALGDDRHTCELSNECLVQNGGCSHTCTDTATSYTCSCPDGYYLGEDEHTCKKIIPSTIMKLAEISHATQLTENTGAITSQNWPELTYPVNVDQKWVIKCPSSNQQIQLNFKSPFGLGGQLPDCPKDWLRIRDPSSMEILQQYCHIRTPPNIKFPMSSVLVEFHAGPEHGSSRLGFQAEYTCVDPPTPPPPTSETPITILSRSQGCSPVVLPKRQLCHTIMKESAGRFTTPNWPLTYNIDEECEWFIALPDCTKSIEVTFQQFSVAGQMPDCSKDQVYVSEGVDGNGITHGPFCSLDIPVPLTLRSHVAHVTMTAGSSHGALRLGFTATYKSVER